MLQLDHARKYNIYEVSDLRLSYLVATIILQSLHIGKVIYHHSCSKNLALVLLWSALSGTRLNFCFKVEDSNLQVAIFQLVLSSRLTDINIPGRDYYQTI